MPPFLVIGQNMEIGAESDPLKSFHTAGFLGSEYGPFNLPYPMDAVAAVRPPKGVTRDRFANRERALKRLVKESPLGELASDYHQQSMLRSIDNAHRLLDSKERDAFDLAREPKETFDRYNTGRFNIPVLTRYKVINRRPTRPLPSRNGWMVSN